MAIIDRAPTQAIIDGFKGAIDFYRWKDIWVVRKWPVWNKRSPHPEESLNQQSFSYINRLWGTLPGAIQDLYRTMASGTPLTGKDLFVTAYMGGLNYTQE